MTSRSARPVRLAALALTGSVLLAACGSDGWDEAQKAAAPSTPTPTATASATPPTPPTAPAPVDPLTGLAPQPQTPLLAVKIDNGVLARPYHRGLETASIVYVELVEGGTTRFVALWSHAPDIEIGPIRSLRNSDLELALQHGKVGFAFSGAAEPVLATFAQSVAAGQVVDVSFESRQDLYRIGERRKDAKNFYARPAVLAAAAAGATPAKDIGLRFAEAPRPDAGPGTAATVRFSPREAVEVRYDPATQRYSLSIDGRPFNGVAAANVVVQQTPVQLTGNVDVVGNRTPYSVTVGSGAADVLRDGVRMAGQWVRPDPAAGTRLVHADGSDMPLKPGPTWVLLQPAGSALSIR